MMYYGIYIYIHTPRPGVPPRTNSLGFVQGLFWDSLRLFRVFVTFLVRFDFQGLLRDSYQVWF